MQRKKHIFFILFFFIFLVNCNKDVSVPNEYLEKLFGSWTWMQSSGGFTGGQTTTPMTEGYSQDVEFNRNGIYKLYQDGKQKEKMKFSLTEEPSNNSTGIKYIIKYDDAGIITQNKLVDTQSILFEGEDTLFLNDQCVDCYGHTYIRQK